MIAVYCITRGKLELAKKSLKMLRQWAGCEFDLFVFDQNSGPEMASYLKGQKSSGKIHSLVLSDENVGQNLAANKMLDDINQGNYDWVLRWDPDALPRTRRFLKKLVACAELFREKGIEGVYSPKIMKLDHEPEAFMAGDDIGFNYEVVRILGGICRLHPAWMFYKFRFHKFGAMGFGEAMEMARNCVEENVPKIRIPHIEVEHAYGNRGQCEKWPEDFAWEKREACRYVSYGLL